VRIHLIFICLLFLSGCSFASRLEKIERRQSDIELSIKSISNTTVKEMITYHFDSQPKDLPTDAQVSKNESQGNANKQTTPITPTRIEIIREIENTTVSETKETAKELAQLEIKKATDAKAGSNWLVWLLIGALVALVIVIIIFFKSR